ncbi:MAG: DUF4625 domain-containing protein [Candidatus Azobacteroides sp.]|nr:DUF4625 domain-containing protein [Candidatus Azobacteroides sp.]
MNKLFISKSIAILITVSLFLLSCDSDDMSDPINNDTTKPTISLISPEEGAYIPIGDEEGMHLEMELSDDVMLGSYKIDIHSNFDGHTHRSETITTTTDFSFQRVWELSGQKNAHIHHHDIVTPADVTAGNYHMVIYCVDAAGNESHLARNIILYNK